MHKSTLLLVKGLVVGAIVGFITNLMVGTNSIVDSVAIFFVLGSLFTSLFFINDSIEVYKEKQK